MSIFPVGPQSAAPSPANENTDPTEGKEETEGKVNLYFCKCGQVFKDESNFRNHFWCISDRTIEKLADKYNQEAEQAEDLSQRIKEHLLLESFSPPLRFLGTGDSKQESKNACFSPTDENKGKQ